MTSKQYLPHNLPCNAYTGVKQNPAFVVVFAVRVNGVWTSRREGCKSRKQAAQVLWRYRHSLAFARKTIAQDIATQGKGQFNNPSVYMQFSYPWLALFSGRIGVFDHTGKLVGKAFNIRKLKFPEGTELSGGIGTIHVYYPPKYWRKAQPARLAENEIKICKPTTTKLPPLANEIPHGVKTYPISHATDLHVHDPKWELLLWGGLPAIPLITPDTPSLTLRHELAEVVPSLTYGATRNGKRYDLSKLAGYPQGRPLSVIAEHAEPWFDTQAEFSVERKLAKVAAGKPSTLPAVAFFSAAVGYPHWIKDMAVGELDHVNDTTISKWTHRRIGGSLWYTEPLLPGQLVG